MYSRSAFSSPDEPYRIPENYRGNAFHGDQTVPKPPIESSLNEQNSNKNDVVPTPSDLPPHNITDPPLKTASEQQSVSASVPLKKEPPSLLSSLLPPKPKGLHGGTNGGILGDIGTEELLIIGIILLLSQNNSDDDILLLLLLLLFYK